MVGLLYLVRICTLRFCCVCGGGVIRKSERTGFLENDVDGILLLVFRVATKNFMPMATASLFKLALKTKRTMVDRSAQYRLS